MAIFSFFCFKKCAEIPIFIVLFWTSPKNCQKMAKKTKNFFTFCKTEVDKKKTVLLQPPFWPNISVFFFLFFLSCLFWNQKPWCWTKNITQIEAIAKIRKRNLKEKKTGNQKQRKYWWRKNLQLNFLMLFLSWKKSKEERKRKKETKTRNQKTAKNKDKKEERKKRRKKTDSERETQKEGGQKRLREKERETLKINKKCLFSRGKQGFFCIKQPKNKKSKTKNKIKRNKNK